MRGLMAGHEAPGTTRPGTVLLQSKAVARQQHAAAGGPRGYARGPCVGQTLDRQ